MGISLQHTAAQCQHAAAARHVKIVNSGHWIGLQQQQAASGKAGEQGLPWQ
jgi:hypothetical protein